MHLFGQTSRTDAFFYKPFPRQLQHADSVLFSGKNMEAEEAGKRVSFSAGENGHGLVDFPGKRGICPEEKPSFCAAV